MARLMLPLLWILLVAAAPAEPPPETSCTACHLNPDVFSADDLKHFENWSLDAHLEVGLSCHDCHGGNPDPALAEDADAAMNAGYAAAPFRGRPARRDIPGFCGRCHSDPVFMKAYRPDPRIDQETEYWTSRHGKALRAGDENVATCIDCHGTHGIIRPDHTESPVYPTRVAETCGHCHSDPEHMRGYRQDDGRPLPVDQVARWTRSVHANALMNKGDLSAPTCNDCHGNHGATPPGVESVATVCGQCHGREATLFRASPKVEGFHRHNEFLADSGDERCAACHETPEPQASVTRIHSFSDCVTCHENHGVVRPTMALLAPLPATPCAFCHEEPPDAPSAIPEPERIRKHYVEVRDRLLVESTSMGEEDRLDWLVDQALALPWHTEPSVEGEQATLKPEFSRLYERFRIGKTHYTYVDPATGQEVKARINRCTDCHGDSPALASAPTGWQTARDYVTRMNAVTARVGRAERILLAARRGGVEVKEALTELDKAVDSQIELEVLVHSFSVEEGSAFRKKQEEGLAHAEAALEAGNHALGELGNRRRGLGISLIFIVLTLIGLGLKIRQMGSS